MEPAYHRAREMGDSFLTKISGEGLPVTAIVAKGLRCEAAFDMSQSGDLSNSGQMQETRPSDYSRRMNNR